MKVKIRNTKSRGAVLTAIEASAGPLLLDEILRKARRTHRSLGIATLYRALKTLSASGEIRSVTLPNGENRFEKVRGVHHHHFQCRACRKIFHLDVCPLSIPSGTVFPGGMLVESHDLVLYGLCAKCQ